MYFLQNFKRVGFLLVWRTAIGILFQLLIVYFRHFQANGPGELSYVIKSSCYLFLFICDLNGSQFSEEVQFSEDGFDFFPFFKILNSFYELNFVYRIRIDYIVYRFSTSLFSV